MNKINLNDIHNSLDNIEGDIDDELDTLEGEAPDHMNFRKVRSAQEELKEQVEYLRKWIDNFNIGEIDRNTY